MVQKVARAGNAVLASLAAPDRARLLDMAKRVSLETGSVISSPESPIERVYFPETAVLSILSVMGDRSAVETAVVGNDGMAPMALCYGVTSSTDLIVAQVPGDAWCVTREAFSRALTEIPALLPLLHRFTQALFTLTGQSSACNRKHSVVERCARWLLLTHDRVPGDEFQLTHIFLSQMLGVRRSSVTIAAEALRKAGAITYTRGVVRIIDRETLRSRSCECYDIIRSTYDRLVDGRHSPSPLTHLVMSENGQLLAHNWDTDKRESPGGRTPASGRNNSLDDLRTRLQTAVESSQELQVQLDSGELSTESMSRVSEKLSVALRELQLVEVELRSHLETQS